ncbi:hypothetical protein MYAM1_000161 [Malassezia yamatoensis]|uniref:Uncharacterized protein n=1 Tax=Malassezia yamatoensis TaxID=253288 RepID=A0AAJ5YTT0_9BASI|nr:hypothetical protein MYAM1_000161 [Malassezia yamatoensis]
MRRVEAVRAFSTCANLLQKSRRSQHLSKRKNDECLRQAISLYHLSPSFYPVVKGEEDGELSDAVTASILGQFLGEHDGRPFVQFSNTFELLKRHRQEVQTGRKDALGELDMYDTLRIQHTLASDLPSRSEPGSEADEQPVRLRQQFVHQPSSYSNRRARDAAGHGDLYSNEELSARSAKVRDALFGTVAGELPGLEIVRDREREWKKKDE